MLRVALLVALGFVTAQSQPAVTADLPKVPGRYDGRGTPYTPLSRNCVTCAGRLALPRFAAATRPRRSPVTDWAGCTSARLPSRCFAERVWIKLWPGGAGDRHSAWQRTRRLRCSSGAAGSA